MNQIVTEYAILGHRMPRGQGRAVPTELSKPVLRVLERCFVAELQGMPAQFGRAPHYEINGIQVSAAVARANAAGLIEQIDHKMPGRPPVVVRGFRLTRRGHIAYCSWASRQA